MLYCNYRRLVTSTVVLLLFSFAVVECVENGRTQAIGRESEQWKANETPATGSSLWAPEFYDGGYRKDFITPFNENKYPNNNPLYPSKPRQGFSPFSSGSLYTPGGLYRPVHATTRPIDYGVHDYDSPYDNSYQNHGYGLNHPYNPHDLTRSMWIPLAGAALLGIAAALVANPVLLHFGVTAGKRKRREVSQKRFEAHDLAYRSRMHSVLSVHQ